MSFSPGSALLLILAPALLCACGGGGGGGKGVLVPGCSVADDFQHALGDPAEALFESAVDYIANGACPLPPGVAQPRANGIAIKSMWRQNRISRAPAAQ